MLRRLGFDYEASFHMNEGHSALWGSSCASRSWGVGPTSAKRRSSGSGGKACYDPYPVPAGHDQFPIEVALGALRLLIASAYAAYVFLACHLPMTSIPIVRDPQPDFAIGRFST